MSARKTVRHAKKNKAMENEEKVIETGAKCECKSDCKCCKCLPYVCMCILAVAVIVLYVLFFTSGKKNANVTDVPVSAAEQLPIAFVNMDSLLVKYELYNKMQDELISQQERSRATLNQKAKALQSEMQDFQNKLENRAFLSEERARSEQERLIRKQQELEQLQERYSQELMAKQAHMTDSLFNIIQTTVKEYNAEKNYHFIFSNTGNANILYGNSGYDITNDIVELLNKPE